jgi:Ca2+-binding EF-hand superfamily protein
MRKLTLFTAAGALALGGAGIALASQHGPAHNGPGQNGLMERADSDGDGEITLAEAKAHGGERFARMDANGDGAIDKADREARGEQRFARADANGDGELTPEEMTAAREARQAKRAAMRGERQAQRQAMMFERLDTDGSGSLSQAEMQAGKAMRGEARGERRGPRGEGRSARRGGRDGAGAMRMLRRADTDNDAAVSRDEFDAMIEARFARLDTDGSGTITAAEREAAKSMRGKHRRGQREDSGSGS